MSIFHSISSHKIVFIILCLAIIIVFAVIIWVTRKPSNNRNWNTDQRILSTADINGKLITIHNIRNFNYQSQTEYTPGYYDKTFDLDKIKRIYYVVEPFTKFQGPAHTFLTFEFEDNNFVAVSIEIRKRQGQVFSEWKSALPYYELMYVVADENDVVKLRSNYRKDKVYMYPVKAEKGPMQSIFLYYMNRVNQLREHPEFYNLFTNTCTTNIVDAVNQAGGAYIPWSYKVLLPSYSDEYAMSLGLLDTNLPLDEARKKYQINDLAEKYGSDPDFSVQIRQNMR